MRPVEELREVESRLNDLERSHPNFTPAMMRASSLLDATDPEHVRDPDPEAVNRLMQALKNTMEIVGTKLRGYDQENPADVERFVATMRKAKQRDERLLEGVPTFAKIFSQQYGGILDHQAEQAKKAEALAEQAETEAEKLEALAEKTQP